MTSPSYVCGVSTTALIGDTIGRYFDAVCVTNANRPALIVRHQNVNWTFSELRRHVNAFAGGLHRLGLARGDRIAIWAPNCSEWLVTQYASAKLGLVLVNINPAYRIAEVEYVLNKVGCTTLVTAPRHKGSDYVAMLCDMAPELLQQAPGRLSAKRLPDLKRVITLGVNAYPGCLRFQDLLVDATDDVRQIVEKIGHELQFDDPINIQFTSGTTGFPKAATLSHHNILNNGFFVGESMQLQPEDRLCSPVPLYHCFGMVMANLACLTHAACVVYPAESFEALAVLEAIDAERCTVLYGVPTMFIAMLGHPEFGHFDLTSLRTGIMAGSPCPVEVMREVVERMHLSELTIAYGMTETSPVSFQSNTADSLDRRVTTVGRVHPHLEVKIVDRGGRVVPRGATGELCTRGYSVMLGYWGDSATTAEVLDAAGWMHSADLATLDDEDYCSIVGRLKDMVIRGGENIYPREIEEFLYRHPAVKDVQVIGVPDPKYGEELCAWIIVKPGCVIEPEALREFCREQIAHYKIPRYIKFVEAFPTTVTGKVQKFAMREMMLAELGLSEQETA